MLLVFKVGCGEDFFDDELPHPVRKHISNTAIKSAKCLRSSVFSLKRSISSYERIGSNLYVGVFAVDHKQLFSFICLKIKTTNKKAGQFPVRLFYFTHLITHCKSKKQYHHRDQSSWCGRIFRVVDRCVRRCVRRSNRVVLATSLLASEQCDNRRSNSMQM